MYKIPSPGARGGPCESKCRHGHCYNARRIATMTCATCMNLAGYNRMLYTVKSSATRKVLEVEHAACRLLREETGGAESKSV